MKQKRARRPDTRYIIHSVLLEHELQFQNLNEEGHCTCGVSERYYSKHLASVVRTALDDAWGSEQLVEQHWEARDEKSEAELETARSFHNSMGTLMTDD